MQVEPWWMLVSPQALQLVHHLDFRLMTRSQKAIMKSTVVVNFSSSHWKSEVKQWKSKAEHEIKLKNTSPILYVSSKQKMHSENRWWNFDRHQQKISIANELQKLSLRPQNQKSLAKFWERFEELRAIFFESPFVVFMAKISSHIVRSVRLPEKRSVVEQ